MKIGPADAQAQVKADIQAQAQTNVQAKAQTKSKQTNVAKNAGEKTASTPQNAAPTKQNNPLAGNFKTAVNSASANGNISTKNSGSQPSMASAPVSGKATTAPVSVTTEAASGAANVQNQIMPRLDPDSATTQGYSQINDPSLPNPRDVSNAVSAQNGERTFASNGASALLWSWGQFVDHDITLTKESEVHANIAIPTGDPVFDPAGTGEVSLDFKRSDFVLDAEGNRQQINLQTPLIDASMVYGADEDTTNSLRSFKGGKLLTAADGVNLPTDAEGKVMAGDPRAGEQPGLESLHTLFVNEHNRIAEKIADNKPHLSDQKLFDKAQKKTTYEIQAITYNEFLPTLLGDSAPSVPTYTPGVDGSISNEFATSAYRLGHTMVNDSIEIRNDDGSVTSTPLKDVFFQQGFVANNGYDNVLSGMSGQIAEAVDPMITDSLRNTLFGEPGSGGLDLASLNIQRGRDHELPSYNDMRISMGLAPVNSFDSDVFQEGLGAKLSSVYSSPDQMDSWVGMLSEKSYGNSMLGETQTKMVAEQFWDNAAANPYFFTNASNSKMVSNLGKLTLSDIIKKNSDALIDDTAMNAVKA